MLHAYYQCNMLIMFNIIGTDRKFGLITGFMEFIVKPSISNFAPSFKFAIIEELEVFDAEIGVWRLQDETGAEYNTHILIKHRANVEPMLVPVHFLQRLMVTKVPGALPVADWVDFYYAIEIDSLYDCKLYD